MRRSAIALALLFAAASGLLFGGYRLGRAAFARPDRTIVVGAEALAGLRADLARRTGRAATSNEDDLLVRRYVDQEILFREAVGLGLWRGDPIVRRRLIQLMELRAEDTAAGGAVGEGEIAALLAEAPDRFVVPARIALRQVFVARREGARAEAEALLSRLRSGAEPAALGEPFLGGAELGPSSEAEIASRVGPGFARAAFALPAESDGEWRGPLESTFGFHLVQITGRSPARAPSIAEARPEATRELLEHRRAHARAQLLEHLRGRYRVVRAGGQP